MGDLVEVAVVDLEARGFGTGCDALDVFDGEAAVGGGAAGLDAELLLGVVQKFFAAHDHAGDVRANVHEVGPDGFPLEHLVERASTQDLSRRGVGELCDVLHGFVGDVAVLLLAEVDERDQRRLLLRISGDDLLGHDHVVVGQAGHAGSVLPPTIIGPLHRGRDRRC